MLSKRRKTETQPTYYWAGRAGPQNSLSFLWQAKLSALVVLLNLWPKNLLKEGDNSTFSLKNKISYPIMLKPNRWQNVQQPNSYYFKKDRLPCLSKTSFVLMIYNPQNFPSSFNCIDIAVKSWRDRLDVMKKKTPSLLNSCYGLIELFNLFLKI